MSQTHPLVHILGVLIVIALLLVFKWADDQDKADRERGE